jgi:hypothetical protein
MPANDNGEKKATMNAKDRYGTLKDRAISWMKLKRIYRE